MRKYKGANWKKRSVSVVLILGLVLGMLEFGGMGSVSRAEEKDSDKTIEYANNTVTRIRAVVDKLKELPGAPTDGSSSADWKNWVENTWYNGEKGSIERPFLVLEIVPYDEVAEFGYLIEGCEPVDFSRMQGNEFLYGAGNLNSVADISMPTEAYFFGDENEGKKSYYYRVDNNTGAKSDAITNWDSLKVADGKELFGYYEVVKDGEGDFKYVYDAIAETASFVLVDKTYDTGNIKWHTMNEYLIERMDEEYSKGIGPKRPSFYARLENMTYTETQSAFLDCNFDPSVVGNRFYTSRVSSSTSPCYNVSYHYFDYRNKDIFATDIIGKTKKEAASYSVYYKAITPVELNKDPGWVDVADLIYVSAKETLQVSKNLWQMTGFDNKPANRLQKTSTLPRNSQPTEGYKGNYGTESPYNGDKKDLNWDVTKAILKRVASSKNYVGLMFCSNVFTGSNLTTKNVTYRHYDVNNNLITTEGVSGGIDGYLENIGKLLIMSSTLNANLVNKLFVENDRITESDDGYGYINGRTEDEGRYWSGLSFYIGSATLDEAKGTFNGAPGSATTKYWRDYSGRVYLGIEGTNTYVQGHVYVYNGENSIRDMRAGEAHASESIFTDFNEYIDTNARTKDIWVQIHKGETIDGIELEDESMASIYYDEFISSYNVSPSAALRYILDLDRDSAPYYYDSVRVLEIEPSCGLNADSTPYYQLTKEEVYLMVPNCSGDVTIDSMIMNSFVGRIDDLNETYDLIYLGDEVDGFFLTPDYDSSSEKSSMSRKEYYKKHTEARTEFTDNSLDGLVYFQTGDLMYVPGVVEFNNSGSRASDANFIHGHDTGNRVRQPGNDLTALKMNDLESFIKAGYPIVAADHLLEPGYVENSTYSENGVVKYNCVMYEFLNKWKADDSKKNSDGTYKDGVFVMDQVAEIDARVKNKKSRKMEIYDSPWEYDPDCTSYGPYHDKGYLKKSVDGYGILNFGIRVPDAENYAYRVYVDKDRNGKCEASDNALKNEVVRARNLESTDTYVTLEVNDSWVGFIQWKIEVYDRHNENIRLTKTGCSAIPADEDKKNTINALQIIPNSGNLVDMKSSLWKGLYENVQDFNITVNSIKINDFLKVFEDYYKSSGKKFSFDMGKEVDIADHPDHPELNNPKLDVLHGIEDQVVAGLPLGKYNMLIIGFADMYGSNDFSNKYGAAEYLFYCAKKKDPQSCSILFTHDLTCYYNCYNPSSSSRNYGYTANSMLRELMGMNIYGALSDRLYTDTTYFRENLADNLEGYKRISGAKYSHTSKDEQQGFTLFCAMKKLGANGYSDNKTNKNQGGSQYYYLVHEPSGAWTDSKHGQNSGDNNLVTLAVNLNKGQITTYPYNIPNELPIAQTHCQYYALNMEDPEVTCWFTLEYPRQYGKSWSTGAANNAKGLVMAVVPQDPSNNYYIYSKGNIYYTGVGHSGLGNTASDEMRLFVNTLIAAYRPHEDAPYVLITNATEVSFNHYEKYVEQEVDYYKDAESGVTKPSVSNLDDSKDLLITFIPKDLNGCNQVSCWVYFENAPSRRFEICNIAYDENGKMKKGGAMPLDEEKGDNVYTLDTDQEYLIVYNKDDLQYEGMNKLVFEIENSVTVGVTGKTFLEIKKTPFFRLD